MRYPKKYPMKYPMEIPYEEKPMFAIYSGLDIKNLYAIIKAGEGG